MRSLVVALLALAPATALAQFTITLNTQQEEVSLGPDDCNGSVSVTWSVLATQTMCSDMVFWLTANTSCGSSHEPGADDVELKRFAPIAGAPHATSGNFLFPTSDLPLFQGASAPACPAEDEERTYRVCAAFQTPNSVGACDGSSGRLGLSGQPPRVTYDTRPPGAPTIASAQPLDGAAAVNVTAEEGVTSVVVEATAEGQSTRTADQDIRNGRIVISGLANGIEYQLIARARDLAGNESEPSEAVAVTPVETAGFWQAYKNAGGKEEGGCSQAGGGVLGLGGLLLARLFGRRRS